MPALPTGMNKTQTAAYQWLKARCTGIAFNRRKTPDFYTDQGSFEIKKIYGTNTVVFSYRQLDSTLKAKSKVLVFKEGASGPFTTLEPSDLEGGITSVEKKGILLRMSDEGSDNTVLKIRTDEDAILAFGQWVADYRSETKDRKATQGDAFKELLRRVGKLPPKGQVYA
jgi:hypothetical protein